MLLGDIIYASGGALREVDFVFREGQNHPISKECATRSFDATKFDVPELHELPLSDLFIFMYRLVVCILCTFYFLLAQELSLHDKDARLKDARLEHSTALYILCIRPCDAMDHRLQTTIATKPCKYEGVQLSVRNPISRYRPHV